MRRLRSFYSNYYHTTPLGAGFRFIGDEGAGGRVTGSPSYSYWFDRFVKGCHRRMGDVWIPDRPLMVIELQKALELLEEDWVFYGKDLVGRRETSLTAVMLIVGFFAALRGEEIVRTDLGSMRLHWDESALHPVTPHVPLMLAGRFKGELGDKLFCQPLSPKSASGVDIMLWCRRAIDCLEAQGITSGPMFRSTYSVGSSYKKGTVSLLDNRLHGILTRVQYQWPEILPRKVDVEAEFSCYRSLRRGATSAALNAQVPPEVIIANNRWRKHVRARGMTPGMSMLERYSDAKASVPTLIRFSGSI